MSNNKETCQKYKGFAIKKIDGNYLLYVTDIVYSSHDCLQEAQAVADEIIDGVDRWEEVDV